MDQLHPDVDLTKINWEGLQNVRKAAAGEFDFLTVETEVKLKDFINTTGSLSFIFNDEDSGNSYYEWAETQKKLRQNVDVVVLDIENGFVYCGNGIRNLLLLPDRAGAYGDKNNRNDVTNFSPIKVKGRDKYPIFISSTSAARVMKKGQRVLYRNAALRF